MKVNVGRWHFEVNPGPYDWFWQRVQADNWERETFRVFDQYVHSGITAVDIGAWIGATALYLSRLARHVYAYEPDPVAYEELKKNLMLNPDITNVTAVNAAVTNREGTVRLGVRDKPGDSSSSVLLSSGAGWEVEAIALENVMAGTDGAPFVKIDVEGHEFELGARLAESLREHGGTALVALHPHFFGVARAARFGRKSKLQKIAGSFAKRTIGRYEGFHAIRDLAYALERDLIVKDLDGTAISLSRRAKRALIGRNVTDSGSILLTPKKLHDE